MTHSFDKRYWDEVWHGERAPAMATGEPNTHLVHEVADLVPGTALEAGCGAGTEAIWLASRGWQVTAADIATQALARGVERARAAGVAERIEWVEADLSTWEPEARFDLVTTHYAHPTIPQVEFYDRLATWVAPGGTLLIVGHLPGHGSEGGSPPAAASVTAREISARLDPAAWQIQTERESSRTMTGPGSRASTIHDAVVRAALRR